MMLGIGGSGELQVDRSWGQSGQNGETLPKNRTNLQKVRAVKELGCVGVGMDIYHFYGRLVGDKVDRDDIFGPQKTKN